MFGYESNFKKNQTFEENMNSEFKNWKENQKRITGRRQSFMVSFFFVLIKRFPIESSILLSRVERLEKQNQSL
jgi:hypothetical protein